MQELDDVAALQETAHQLGWELAQTKRDSEQAAVELVGAKRKLRDVTGERDTAVRHQEKQKETTKRLRKGMCHGQADHVKK
jgi:hypothetical protein